MKRLAKRIADLICALGISNFRVIFFNLSVGLISTGKMSGVGVATGAVAGLVAITPAAGSVNALGALAIGIGAGEHCDGLVRVTADLLGLSEKQPPFAKPLISGRELFVKSLKHWIDEQHHLEEIPTKVIPQQEPDC